MFSENDRVIRTSTGAEGTVFRVYPNGTLRVWFGDGDDGYYESVPPSALQPFHKAIVDTPPPSPPPPSPEAEEAMTLLQQEALAGLLAPCCLSMCPLSNHIKVFIMPCLRFEMEMQGMR